MSVLKGLRDIGWNGNPTLAAERHAVIISLYELSKHFEFRITGIFPIILTLEHKGELSPPDFNSIDMYITNETDIDSVMKTFNSIFHSVYIINSESLWVDDWYTVNIKRVASFDKLFARVTMRFNNTGYELLSMGGVEKMIGENTNKRKRSKQT